jgi:Domain of unknown function (DUF4145)
MPFNASFGFRDCPWCGVKDVAMQQHHEFSASSTIGRTRVYKPLSCPRCGKVTTLEVTQAGQDGIIEVIPSTPSLDVDHLPPDVREYYQNARRVLDAGVVSSSAVELRRTLEAAASQYGITDGPLVRRIKALIDAGLITTQFGGAMDYIRKLGNIGAHASDEKLDEDDVRRAFRFTTQALRNLFEIPGDLAGLPPDEPPTMEIEDSAEAPPES